MYLVNFKLLRLVFMKRKGEEPSITSASSKIGNRPANDLWFKYSNGKKILFEDYLFSFAQAIIPIGLTVGLAILLS